MIFKTNTLIAIIFIICGSISMASIINVPADYSTIQAGINVSTDNDTVLVQPGMYVENIIFNGHNAILASLFLTTRDSSYISSTIIDGDSSGSVIRCRNGEDPRCTIIGFTIQNGFAEKGGGIYCSYTNPTIMNNIIRNNTATGTNSDGGGICSYRSSGQLIQGNIITGNSVIYSSEGLGNGGGIYCKDAVIRDNIITNNQCTGFGGGFYCQNSIILNNVISENSAYRGGGMHCSGNSENISYNTISDNIATDFGGGILLYNQSSVSIDNNIINNNSANEGAGIFCSQSYPVITNNTIADNIGQTGNAIYVYFYSTPEITNTIVWSYGDQLSELYIDNTSSAIVRYCDIQGGWTGIGNIDTDPMFRDPENTDYHLMSLDCGDPANSLCIDAGYPDIADDSMDCDWGQGTEISDMGAYGGGRVIPNVPRTITIPTDYPTIQDGINASRDLDTVLVLPGIYYENINFFGRGIVLSSLFLTTDDTSYVSSTIIDGDLSGSVITLDSEEDSNTVICGFTIQHGYFIHGGGILSANHAQPRICHNHIKDNTAYHEYGGAGGGIYCRFHYSTIAFNTITNNKATVGGGIYTTSAEPLILNNTISNNEGTESGGGIEVWHYEPEIVNTIVWGNSAPEGSSIYTNSTPQVRFSDIEGGWSGEGNIDCDPLFCGAGIGNYFLEGISCCVGAGEEGVDIGSIGVGCEFLGSIKGIVIDQYDDFAQAVSVFAEGTSIIDSTDTGGEYRLEGLAAGYYDISFTHPDYRDTLVMNFEAISGDTVTLNVVIVELPGVISGFVTNCSTAPVESVYVEINDVSTLIVENAKTIFEDGSKLASENKAENNSFLLLIDSIYTDEFGYYEFTIPAGTYDILLSHEEYNQTILTDVEATPADTIYLLPQLTSYGYQYLPGDANMFLGSWVPQVGTEDVTYLVGYFRGLQSNCIIGELYRSADVNGDCHVIGSDLTRMVNYFRGLVSMSYCPDYPPAWLTSDDCLDECPEDPPPGWPGCDTLTTGSGTQSIIVEY
ncbi:MAG: DUF1565 domain-containing protein [candidate division Zixibacteria bacterium]|nr:DUF1565 domain-containing protein [candidate division Zixibacteria bacterium]